MDLPARYVVIIDKPVPHVAYGLIVDVGPKDQGTTIGYFHDVEAAKLFAESAHGWDLKMKLGLGRLRVFDHATSTVVHELNPG